MKRPLGYYVENKSWGWYQTPEQFELLVRYCRMPMRVKALEIGSFDGVSANTMLDELFPHPESEVHTIDPFLPDPTTPEVSASTRAVFDENCLRGGHGNRIRLYEGTSAEVLAWMAAGENFWESFDFVYIDGSHFCADVFIDAAMCWHLLKPGGIVVFDDYDWKPHLPSWARPRRAIEAFRDCFLRVAEPLWSGASQMGFRKWDITAHQDCGRTVKPQGDTSVASPTKLMFDIGSHDGGDSRRFRSLGFRVVGVDANIHTIRNLIEEFSQDTEAHFVCAAIAARPGIRNFYICDANHSWSSLERGIAARNGCTASVMSVPVVTLDMLFKEFGVPAYLKIDIEGGEIDALKGMTSDVPELLSIEFNHLGLGEEEVLGFLAKKGYKEYAWKSQSDNYTKGYGESLEWRPIGLLSTVPSSWCDLFARKTSDGER